MQASSLYHWAPPSGTLGRILDDTRSRVAALRAREAELRERAAQLSGLQGFAADLRGSTVGVIAEVKRRSPSKGWIRPGISAGVQARSYVDGGAAAISVLTEPVHFAGSPQDLVDVRAAVGVPVLKKDFHVDPVQLVEARALGASAALLIVRALAPGELERMMDAAHTVGIETLVEVRDEPELQRALDAGATVVGVNSRNLETLDVDPAGAQRLLGLIPPGVLAIAESGVGVREDVERAAASGADCVLVGSVISAADDPVAAVHELCGVSRVLRGR